MRAKRFSSVREKSESMLVPSVTDSAGKTVKTVQLDTAPYKKGGRTYVPVRFFAEAFGLTVQLSLIHI